MDTVSYVLAMEEISKVDASTSVCMSVNNSLVCYGLQVWHRGPKREILVPLGLRPENRSLLSLRT